MDWSLVVDHGRVLSEVVRILLVLRFCTNCSVADCSVADCSVATFYYYCWILLVYYVPGHA